VRSRGAHLRTKVVALLVSLAALWAFAAFVTLREGLNLLWVSALTDHVGRPTESLLAGLQQERRLSLVYLGSSADRTAQRADLLAQRERTDHELASFRRHTREPSVAWAASDVLQTRIAEASRLLDGLAGLREAVDANATSRADAAAGYVTMVDAGFRIYGSISSLDDEDIAKQSRTLVALSRAREVLSQEDALLAGALAAGRFSGTEHARFVELVGVQRFQYAEAVAELPAADRAGYDSVVGGEAVGRLRAAEDRVVDLGRTGAAVPLNAASWTRTVEEALGQFRAVELSSAEATLQRAKPAAIGVIVRLALAGGLGLIAVIASIVISITTARSILRQLQRLRDAAQQLAVDRLPRVVDQLRRGDEVDVDVEAPPLAFGTDEVGQVGQAFNAVQRTAVRTAVEQAELRRSIRDVFLSLARRTQALVHRQLNLLDAMERRETDPGELGVLFRVDHLATRMRRNAENLIVLSGAVPGRRWRQPVPMVDVIRGAVAEVEDYARVTVLPIGPADLAGRAVGDVIHLLAELVENAASFSPPYTVVQVGGQPVANGFAVEIEDRGLGMSADALDAANEQLRTPPEFNLTNTARLGLYVVGRLAERHGIRVRLRESPYGGTTAIVLIPAALVAAAAAEPEVLSPEPATPPLVELLEPPSAEPPTVFGLPRRQRQASLPDALADPVPVPAAARHAIPRVRPPEEVRALMTAYQDGTRRGRTAAERAADPNE
jgi:signal transduction histidine kinase